jgi:succinoglycan biosynthesis protein ExoO
MHAAARAADTAPTVSVLIPAYDAERHIVRAIDAALAQTLADIEVIVVDDGSTDRTWALIAEASRRDPRVIGLRLPRNGGPAAARNAAIARASGRWLALLDADDAWTPDRLAELVPRAEALGADLIADDLEQWDAAAGARLGRLLGAEQIARLPGPLTPLDMIRRDMPDIMGRHHFGFVKPLIRRAFLQRSGIRYQEDLLAGEDLMFYVECVARGARFHLAPGAWYIYWVRRDSITAHLGTSLHLSVGNRRLIAMTGEDDPELARLLRRRQIMLDFECFRHAVAERDLGAALGVVRRLPPSYLARRLGAALLRRALARSTCLTSPVAT